MSARKGATGGWGKRWGRRRTLKPCYPCGDSEFPSLSRELHESCLERDGSPPHQLDDDDSKTVRRSWIFGRVLDPQSIAVKKSNRLFLLACAAGMFIDPLFSYLLTVDATLLCLHIDKRYAIIVTTLRFAVDIMYLSHIWLQLKLAYVSKKSLVLGRGELVWDARDVAMHYLRPLGGFLFDVFVILPFPQIMLWTVVPHMIRESAQTTAIMTFMLVSFLFQYVPKIFHVFLMVRRMQRVTGYVFGTAWWGFGLNLLCYVVAAHVAGSCWYLLGMQRVEHCVQIVCNELPDCKRSYVGCPKPIAYGLSQPQNDPGRLTWGSNSTLSKTCFTQSSDFGWGIFTWVVPLATDRSGLEKIILPMFWGIMTLSSFGNALSPTNHMLEAAFCVAVVTCGLLLFTMLIGNIQVFLHSITSKKRAMQLQMRNLEWWMKRRQLPPRLRHRVRQFERQKWAATRGVNEASMVSELPEGLRRDIKLHLCIDLVRQVPLFDQMDDLVLTNICERLKPMLFTRGEMIVSAGDPVQRMLFIVRGYLESSYRMANGKISTCVVGPGNFCGDELVSWCLRKPPVDRYPPSNASIRTLSTAEVFAFEAQDLRYITENFRYKFANEKLKHTARYYSSNWRTWAAVTIQLTWRRYKEKCAERREKCLAYSLEEMPLSRNSLVMSEKDRLRMYTAIITSPKPQDDLVE